MQAASGASAACADQTGRLTSEAGGGSVGFSGCFDTADSGLWFMCAGV